MKQRFSSLDVKVIAHELSNSLVTLRVANVYDLSSKIFLFKFAKPDVKKQVVVDSGFRCHLTSFSRATAAAPSGFVTKIRKFLKTRRVTAVSQIGTDRIIEFQFSDGQYRMFLEFYAGGNIILTDNELNILTLLRIVAEGDGQEELRVGLKYSLDNRQNYGGIPELTKERVSAALQKAVDKDDKAQGQFAGRKLKNKGKDALRKALAVSITEYPPLLVDHAMKITEFDSTLQPVDVLNSETKLDHLLQSLREAQHVVQEITSSVVAKGFIIAKQGKAEPTTAPLPDSQDDKLQQNLIYDDFHPFRPRQFEDDPTCTFLSFDGFNATVDEFFSSIEGQKLESRLQERELNAKKKLEVARQDQAKRLGGLQEAQQLNIRKASAIEANVERVQEAIDAVNGLIAQGMDWVEIGKLIELEQKRNNPVAEIIKLPLRLKENTVTLLLGEEEDLDDEDSSYATDSDVSDSDDDSVEKKIPEKATETRLAIDINLGATPWSNAREYYDQRRSAVLKEQKTLQSSSKALKSAEQKIAQDLRKGLKQEKAVLRPIRQQMWFEKFTWFLSSDGYLVLGGRDAQQNEILYKKYLRKGDVYVHADLHGASSIIIRNNLSTPDAPVPPSTLSQAGSLAVASSSAWDSKAGMSAWWVNADQVSKSAPTGEFLPTGSFMVRGKKNFLPPAQLLLGFGVMFRISEESKARHIKHRLQDSDDASHNFAKDQVTEESIHQSGLDHETYENGSDDLEEDNHDETQSEDEDEERAGDKRVNPLHSANPNDLKNEGNELSMVELNPEMSTAAHEMDALDIDGHQDLSPAADEMDELVNDGNDSPSDASSKPSLNPTAKKGPTPLPRGQRSKAKKIAQKYKDQEPSDRLLAQTLIGSTLGAEKFAAAAAAKEARDAEAQFHKERRRAQHVRTQKETAEHEEVRKVMLDEGIEMLDEEDAEKLTKMDEFVGTPLPGDEILEAIPVCAPWNAMARCKYKVKLQPGTVKKGKAVKEILARWMEAASKGRAVVDEEAKDMEKMWPREVELLRGWKAEECLNCVPVGKVRVVQGGGLAGGGSGSGSTGGGGSGGGKKKGMGGGGKGKGKR